MVVNKRKKNRKLRGSRTYGWGSPKKHRGKGSRGGVGKAGMGKRGQHKMSLLNALGIKNLGSKGFKRPVSMLSDIKAINVGDIDRNIEALAASQAASKKGDTYYIDVSKLGASKVLGSGKVSNKLSIKADLFSISAKEKIEAAGGAADGAVASQEHEKQKQSEKPEAKAKPASPAAASKNAGAKAPAKKDADSSQKKKENNAGAENAKSAAAQSKAQK